MFDAYEVAIRLRVIDKLSPAMAMVSEKLVAANVHATALEKRLDSIGRLARLGALTTGAGIGLALALKASTNEAVRYEQQLNKLRALNLDMRFGAGATTSLQDKATAIAAATKGMTKTEALRIVTETQGITGDLHHTLDLAPTLSKIKFAMEAYMAGVGKGEGHGAGAEKQFGDIIKVMEMRGLMRNFSEDKMKGMADLFVKNFVASGGMVKPSDFLAMMKTGGVAGKSTSDDFLYALGHIMQEKGGNRSGTQLMSAYQNLIAGRSTQQVAENLAKLGLLEKSAIHYGKTGHITKVDAGGLKSAQMMIDNPLDYMNKMILPALQARKIDINDQKKVLPALNQLTSNRTGADFLAQLYLERSQIANYMAQAKNAMGLDQLYQQGADSVIGKQIDLRAKLINLEKTVGEKALPVMVLALEELNSMLDKINPVLERNPGLVKAAVYGLTALAGSLMITGPLMLLTAGVRGMGVAATVAKGLLLRVPDALGATGAAAKGAATPLTNAATGLKSLGAAAGVFLAAYAGYKGGSLLNEHVIEPGLNKATGGKVRGIGDLIYQRTHDDDVNSKTFGQSQFWRLLPGGDLLEKLMPKTAPAEGSGGKHRAPPAFEPWKSMVSQPNLFEFGANEKQRFDPVRPAAANATPQAINNTIVMPDGRVLAQVVTNVQSREAQRPTQGRGFFDGSMSPVPVGLSGRF